MKKKSSKAIQVHATKPINKTSVPMSLVDILSHKRGHGSAGEAKFIDKYIKPLNPQTLYEPLTGNVSAYCVEVLTRDAAPSTTMWSCHIDTVHNSQEDARQLVSMNCENGTLYKQDGKPLGADDGAGVWLMLEMIKAEVPGMYVFHRGEERGCIGSKSIALHEKQWLKTFTHAIAFDRKDTCSIITHQNWGRCCSDAFAHQIANIITDDDCTYILAPDDGGIYTDTASYMTLIPECTNVSIGYYNEHGGDEILDVSYLLWLKDRMIAGFKDNPLLLCERDPSVVETSWRDYAFDYKYYKTPTAYANTNTKPSTFKDDFPHAYSEYDIALMKDADLEDWIKYGDIDEVLDLVRDMADRLVDMRADAAERWGVTP